MKLTRFGLLLIMVSTRLIQGVATASDENDIPIHINGFLNQQTSECNAGDVIPVVIIKRNDPTRMYTTMEQTIDHLDIAASASDGKFTGTFFFLLGFNLLFRCLSLLYYCTYIFVFVFLFPLTTIFLTSFNLVFFRSDMYHSRHTILFFFPYTFRQFYNYRINQSRASTNIEKKDH